MLNRWLFNLTETGGTVGSIVFLFIMMFTEVLMLSRWLFNLIGSGVFLSLLMWIGLPYALSVLAIGTIVPYALATLYPDRFWRRQDITESLYNGSSTGLILLALSWHYENGLVIAPIIMLILSCVLALLFARFMRATDEREAPFLPLAAVLVPCLGVIMGPIAWGFWWIHARMPKPAPPQWPGM